MLIRLKTESEIKTQLCMYPEGSVSRQKYEIGM